MKHDFFERLRLLDASLCPENNNEWSVCSIDLDCSGEPIFIAFGNTPENALKKAEKLNETD